MSLLQVFFIVSGMLLLVISIDIAKKQKFNALHFLIFIFIWLGLIIFTFFPNILNYFWKIFGLQRWADLLVYWAIIFLLYFVILLLNKVEDNRSDLTKLIREIAINNSPKKIISWEICFLIRVYNEWKVIWNTIKELLEKWYNNILVVNDWSKDNSLKILNSFWDKLIVLTHFKNRWWWARLETWFEYLRRYWNTEYVCTYDADWQHQLKDLEKFLNSFKEDNSLQIVLWSRFITKTNTNVKIIRKIILKLWILFTFFISSIKLTDSHNWYRVFRKDILNEIVLTLDDMSYSSEMIDIISTKKIKFKEVPVDILYTDYSIAKWQKSSNAINIAFKMIWNKFFR